MPSSPNAHIQLWFTQLKRFQAVCINNSTPKLCLLNFVNTTIALTLPSAAGQIRFLTAIAACTGFAELQICDLTNYETFRALLDFSHILSNGTLNVLQAAAIPALHFTFDATPYYAALAAG